MATPEMAEAMQPPFFGSEFNPKELLRLSNEGLPDQQLASIGL